MSEPTVASASSAVPGEPYCGHCGYALVGLVDSARCPECGRPIVEVLRRRGTVATYGKRYRSKQKLFGLPLIDVALGPHGNERIGRARGIIAIGDRASGWLAIGGMARGVVAIGGFAIGLFSIGGFAIGLLTAYGGLALSLGATSGGFCLGTLSSGGIAVGLFAQGGIAVGVAAEGGLRYLLLKGHPHVAWPFENKPMFSYVVWPFALPLGSPVLVAALIGLLVLVRRAGEEDAPADPPKPPA